MDNNQIKDIKTLLTEYRKSPSIGMSFQQYIAQEAPEMILKWDEDRLAREEVDRIAAEWQPSPEMINDYIKRMGWPQLSDLSFDHLGKHEAGVLKKAINTAREFSEDIKNKAGITLMLIAHPKDDDCTGYGCGKTTLAKCIHHANANLMYTGYDQTIYMTPKGRFYESRELMGLFDSGDYNPQAIFKNFGNLVVIDDLGREGSLKWERRDPDLQLAEKQSRYYNIINHCYRNDISMVITSNMTSRELASFLGGASWSRLLEMCPKKYRINMTGIRDMRPLLAEQEWF